MNSNKSDNNYRKYKTEKLADDVVANSKQIFLKETQPSGIEFEEQQLTSLYPNILVDDFKWVLMGDDEQYEGARNLWVSLSNNPGFNVDIVELATGKIIAKNVNLKDALDPRIWTDDELMLTGTKEERMRGRFNRLILTKVL